MFKNRIKYKFNLQKFRLAYVILLMAIFWALEIIPLPITALFPVVLFPLLGINDAGRVP